MRVGSSIGQNTRLQNEEYWFKSSSAHQFMENKKLEQFRRLLEDKSLIHSLMPSIDGVLDVVKNKKTIRLIYGETYDGYGQTLDSFKYYFFLHTLHSMIESLGLHVSSFVVIGDAHSVKNKIVKDKEYLLSISESRMELLKKIKDVYGLKFEPLLMTPLLQEERFIKNLQTVIQLFNESLTYQEIAKKTVLQNRISQEEKAGFQYVLEEVALIIDYDIKIGPPRENNYDNLAHRMGEKVGTQLNGIYLKPTYPLGMSFDFFVTHPEIEEYGLTPYKAGSNKLQDFRIIMGATTKDRMKELIYQSFAPKNPMLPNPVYDVYLISQLAKSILTGTKLQANAGILNDPDLLKDQTFEELTNYILKPMGS